MRKLYITMTAVCLLGLNLQTGFTLSLHHYYNDNYKKLHNKRAVLHHVEVGLTY